LEDITMLAERLTRARKAANLSYREAAERLGLSHTAISRYEKGDLIPSSEQLARLAKVYGVRMDFFLRQHRVAPDSFQFRKRARLTGHRLEAIKYRILDQIERRIELETYLPARAAFTGMTSMPARIRSMEDIDEVTEQLRAEWALGLDPIPDLADLLERQGFFVLAVELEADEESHFDGLATRIEEQPVLVMGSHWPGDRQRFTLAHELGHILLHDRLAPELDEEKACNRFAGAFLLPGSALRRALGDKRRRLEMRELQLLKQEFGLSQQAIVFRAQQTGVITEQVAKQLHFLYRQRGWHKVEPGQPLPPERTAHFEGLVYHALAEDLISESKAAELLGLPLLLFRQQRRMDPSDAAADQ
jgi:Zn-dependent peptidase ImmA (M78 family)/DNA-binding XRE family transcriptional regulator